MVEIIILVMRFPGNCPCLSLFLFSYQAGYAISSGLLALADRNKNVFLG